jgi:integrase/recombinase XerD
LNYKPVSKKIYFYKSKSGNRVQKSPECSDELYKKMLNFMVMRNYSSRTIETYESHLRNFINYFGENQVMNISSDQINDYIHNLMRENNYSRSYQNQLINAIKVFYKTVNNRKLEDIEPIRPKSEIKFPVVLSRDEIKKTVKAIRNIKHQTIILLIYGTGIRLGESVNIKVEDVDFDRNLIHIKTGKGKKDRIVPLPNLLYKKIRYYKEIYSPTGYLFEGRNKGKYSTRSVQSILKTALNKAGIEKKASVHTLRHTFATHACEEGTDIRLIKEILGHENIKTTEIYVHISKTSILNIQSPIDKLDL